MLAVIIFLLVVALVFHGIFFIFHFIRNKKQSDFLQSQAATQLHAEKIDISLGQNNILNYSTSNLCLAR